MKANRLLKKMKTFLNAEERKRKEKRKFVIEVLAKLKGHEKALRKELKAEGDSKKRAKLENEIEVTRAHRKKGLKKLRKV